MAEPDKTDPLAQFLADHGSALLSGDAAVFDDFATLLFPLMKGYFRKHNFEEDVARSRATDVGFKFWKIIGNPKSKPANLEPGYIYAIARSVRVDYLRQSRQRKPPEQLPEGFEPASEHDPESSLLRSADVDESPLNAKQRRCRRALNSIKERYQVILRMRYGEEEKSIEEIAIALNIKESNVHLLLWRAVKAANKKFDEDKGP